MYGRTFANVLIGILSLWSVYAVLTSVLGVPIVFPMSSGGEAGVPLWRLHVIRQAVFGTFAFYGIMHLLHGSKEVYPVHFLRTFLFSLGLMGLLSLTQDILKGTAVFWTDWAIAIFFIWAGSVLLFASAPKFKRIFGSKWLRPVIYQHLGCKAMF